jgi:hypothetical protein
MTSARRFNPSIQALRADYLDPTRRWLPVHPSEAFPYRQVTSDRSVDIGRVDVDDTSSAEITSLQTVPSVAHHVTHVLEAHVGTHHFDDEQPWSGKNHVGLACAVRTDHLQKRNAHRALRNSVTLTLTFFSK